MPDTHKPWPRLIAFTDMNAFFTPIEQLDDPEYRGKPIGVTNGKTGTHTTTRLKHARELCPGFIQVPARPERYAGVSTGINHALLYITPDAEVFPVKNLTQPAEPTPPPGYADYSPPRRHDTPPSPRHRA